MERRSRRKKPHPGNKSWTPSTTRPWHLTCLHPSSPDSSSSFLSRTKRVMSREVTSWAGSLLVRVWRVKRCDIGSGCSRRQGNQLPPGIDLDRERTGQCIDKCFWNYYRLWYISAWLLHVLYRGNKQVIGRVKTVRYRQLHLRAPLLNHVWTILTQTLYQHIPNITSHRGGMIDNTNSHYLTYGISPLKGWENVLFEHGSKSVNAPKRAAPPDVDTIGTLFELCSQQQATWT